MKVLMVHDNEENLHLFETVLKGSGYEVVSARNGVEALKRLKKDSIDMIISDILMPKMDGFQLCRECKKDDKLRKIPFIIYTATYTEKKDEDFALSLGAEKFIIKPVEPKVFLKILEGVIEKYAKGPLVAPKRPIEEETIYLSQYNERLIERLEKKMLDLEKANKALKESEQKYRELVDKANYAVIVIEPTGYLSFVNPKFCQMMGYTMEEVKKLHFSKLIHPEDLAMVTENFKGKLSGQQVPKDYKLRALTKRGDAIYVDYDSAVIEREGRIVGIQAVISDITERKKAEEEVRQSEEKYRMLFENANDVILYVNKYGKIIDINKRVEDIFGYTRDEVVGKNFVKLGVLRPKNIPRIVKLFQDAIEGKKVTSILELEFKNKNGKMVPIEASTRVIKRNGKIVGTMNILRDISARKKAEEEIKAKSQFLESLIEQSPLPTFVIDSAGIVVIVNKAFLKAYSVPKKEMVLGKNALTEAANVRQGVVKYIKEALSGKVVETPEIEFISPHQNKKTVTKSRLFPIFDTANRLTNVVVMQEDITERKKMEEKERQYFSDLTFLSKTAMELVEFTSNKDIHCYVGEQIRQLFPQSIVIISSFDKTTDLFRVRAVLGMGKSTTRFLKILRRDPVGMMTLPINDKARRILLKGELTKVPGGLYELTFNQIPQSVCSVLEKLFGMGGAYVMSFIWKGELCGSAAILMRKGTEPKNPKLIETFVRQASVTLQRLQTEDQIKASLKEKEVLLREIHHRVKNNLQIISSLLNLQSRYIKDKQVLHVFKESQDRIKSMALIHKKLYQSKNLARIDFAEYVRSLIADLFRSYNADYDLITLKTNIDDVFLGIDTAIPCGLIINELVSNSLKYAFPEGGQGEIRIDLHSEKEGKFSLIVSDSGVGFPKDLDFRNTESLGLQLACTLVDQLQGTIGLDRTGGTKFKIAFTEPKNKQGG